jgi:heptosyltransferase-2
MRVGVLEPGHLGDLVLAAPALAALRRRFGELTLFCQRGTAPLARHLFPGLRLHIVHFPHLDKTRTPGRPATPASELAEHADLLVCLRWDRELERLLDHGELEYHGSGLDRLDIHVAAEQQAVVCPFTGAYDLLSYRYPLAPPLMRPGSLRSVGLCIAAGFPLNAWPLAHWLGLAERLRRRGIECVLLGGPAEAVRLRLLADAFAAANGWRLRVIQGGANFAGVLRSVAESTDLVIATDSGTAHLASLVRPVLSLFGGSPWRRYAPLGPANWVLSRGLSCSPCVQFDRLRLNTCHTQECLANLTPAQVEACLDAYLEGKELARPTRIGGLWAAQAPWRETALATGAGTGVASS